MEKKILIQRFFAAIQHLIDEGVIRGLNTFCTRYGLNRRNITTDIYIRRDLAKVDAANRRVIDYVLKCP